MSSLKGQFLALLIFDETKGVGDRWNCVQCDVLIMERMSGYNSLCHHTKSIYEPQIAKRQTDSLARASEVMRSLSFSAKTLSAHTLLNCVVLYLQPFSYVENSIIRHSRHNSVSIESHTSYTQALTEHVEGKISALLPSTFAVVFAE